MGGGGIAKKATNFPLKECKRILAEHIDGDTKGKTYLDPCCGWGVRMLASAALDINYIGFDVNPELIVQLNKLGKDIQRFKPNWEFKVYECGSEVFIPELKNKADVIFTSPPYFDLEMYNMDEKHADSLLNYDKWLNSFVKPMISNCYDYAKDNAHVMFNVKNSKKYKLVDDFINIGNKYFKHQKLDTLKTIKRTVKGKGNSSPHLLKSDEDIIVFIK